MSYNPHPCHGLDIKCHAEQLVNEGKGIANTKIHNAIHNISQQGKQHQDAITKTITNLVQPVADQLTTRETDRATQRAHGDITNIIKENLPLIALAGAGVIIVLLVAKVKI